MSDRRLSEVIEQRVLDLDSSVFLPTDVSAGESKEALAMALNNLVRRELIVPIGEGLYARSRKNILTGELMLASDGGFFEVCKQSLTRLGVEWQLSWAEQAYNEGKSKQIPARPVFRVVGDYYPKIFFKNFRIKYENSLSD